MARAWMAAGGVAVDEAIDPADEMLLTIADYPRVEPQHDLLEYFRAGHEARLCLEHALAAAGRRLADTRALLDFACGYGRVTRHLVQALDPARIWSADVLTGGVDFVSRRFGVHGLVSHSDPARLELPRRYDVIWVGSLFSHLPRRSFAAWLTRLLDALSDDGLLVFTTHGPDVVPEVPKDPSGFTFVARSESRTLDTEEYGATFVAPSVLADIARECGVVALAGNQADLWWIQDLWVAARAPVPGLADLARAPLLRGKIDHLKIEPVPGGPAATTHRAWIGGWTLCASHDAPVREVQVLMDGQAVAAAELLPGDPAQTLLPGCEHAVWRLHGDVSALPAGRHVIAATAVAGAGRRFALDARIFDHVPGQPLLWTEA